MMRASGIYAVVRECHVRVEDERVREECERLVNVLMRGEEGEELDEIPMGAPGEGQGVGVRGGVRQGMVQELQVDDGESDTRKAIETKDDDDDEIVEVF